MNNLNNQKSKQFIEGILRKIEENNPYGFILRPDLGVKTGGLLHGRTMANRDSAGSGIDNRFKVGKTTAYPIESVISFLKKRISVNG